MEVNGDIPVVEKGRGRADVIAQPFLLERWWPHVDVDGMLEHCGVHELVVLRLVLHLSGEGVDDLVCGFQRAGLGVGYIDFEEDFYLALW